MMAMMAVMSAEAEMPMMTVMAKPVMTSNVPEPMMAAMPEPAEVMTAAMMAAKRVVVAAMVTAPARFCRLPGRREEEQGQPGSDGCEYGSLHPKVLLVPMSLPIELLATGKGSR
jgi:hypothetical protein